MRKGWIIVFSLVMFAVISAAAVAAALDAGPPPVMCGIARYSDRQTITFPRPFGAVPVVVTSAQMNGKAVSSCALNNSTANFQISLRDENKAPVQSAWVQWIAFIPRTDMRVIGGLQKASNAGHITFGAMSGAPVIVTNAQIGGKALNSAAVNNSAGGFDIVIRNQDNIPISDAWVQWMAVIPTAANKFRAECSVRNSGDNVTLAPAFPRGPVYVVSAQNSMEPMAAAAVDNRVDGFKLSLVKHDGTAGRTAWTQWIGYAGP